MGFEMLSVSRQIPGWLCCQPKHLPHSTHTAPAPLLSTPTLPALPATLGAGFHRQQVMVFSRFSNSLTAYFNCIFTLDCEVTGEVGSRGFQATFLEIAVLF